MSDLRERTNVFDPRNEFCAFYWQSLHLDGKSKTDTNDANLILTSRDAKASREICYKRLQHNLFGYLVFIFFLERHIMLIDDNVDKRNNTLTTGVAVDWIGKDGSLGG